MSYLFHRYEQELYLISQSFLEVLFYSFLFVMLYIDPLDSSAYLHFTTLYLFFSFDQQMDYHK